MNTPILIEKTQPGAIEAYTNSKIQILKATSGNNSLSVHREDDNSVGFVGAKWSLEGLIGSTVHISTTSGNYLFELYDASIHK